MSEGIEKLCEADTCDSVANFICKTHGYYWNTCSLDFHSACKIETIISGKLMAQNMKHLDVIVNDLEEKNAMYNLSSLYGKMPKGLNTIIKEHKKLKEQYDIAISHQNVKDFPFILEQMHKFKTKIDKSEFLQLVMIKELSKYGKHKPESEKALQMQKLYDQRLQEFRDEKQQLAIAELEEEKVSGTTSALTSKKKAEREVRDMYAKFTKTMVKSIRDGEMDASKLDEIFCSKYTEFYSLFTKLKSFNSSNDVEFSSAISYGIMLELTPDRESDKEAIREMRNANIPPFKKLSITTMERFSEEEKQDINEFFENIPPKTIQYLVLNTGSHQFDDLDIYIDSLAPVLECVTEEIYLHAFTMSPETLSKLINSWNNTKRLIISWCKCQTTDDYTFDIDSSKDYQLEYLNIYWTFYNGGPGHMNHTQFSNLAMAMGETNMVDTLKHVGSGGDYYSTTALTTDQLDAAFRNAGFKNVQFHVGMVNPMDTHY